VITKRTEETEQKYRDSTEDAGAYLTAARVSYEAAAGVKPQKEEEKISPFWRIFGGTLISISALVAITMYNGMNGSIVELRSEISRLNIAKADSAKKDDLGILRTQVSVIAGYRTEIDSLKERATKYRSDIDEGKKDTQTRLDLAKKERDDALESFRKELATVEMTKALSNTTAAELKLAIEQLQRVRQEIEKNQAADLERRDSRTAQMKVIDETLKDIQKNLLESREKIARLEGSQSQTKTAPASKVAESPDR